MLNYNLLGRRIKEIRKSKKISQSQLAELVDLSVSYISYIETAKRIASIKTLMSIANKLDTPVEVFLYGNQKSINIDYQDEIFILIQDCSNYEKRIIFEQIVSLKNSLRTNEALRLNN